ncbi:MAG: hypothetical protein HZC28_18185 [Spirochaetes bacterium]|nr:hypothetical protein [Spirochaetota bacterium]
MKTRWAVYAAVFIISLAVLAFETIINRMFALMFWYHFAFMIISVALFGMGIGSLLVFFFNRFLKEHAGIVLSIVSVLLAAALPFTLLAVNGIPLEMEMLGSATAAAVKHQALFVRFFLILSIPFILGGFIFSYLFTNFRDYITKIYFFDLVGGGLGALAALLIFPHRGPLVASFILAVMVSIAAGLFAWLKIKWFAVIIPVVVTVAGIFFVYPQLKNTEVRVSKGKRDLTQFGRREFADWDNFAYVAMHETRGHLLITADYSCYTDLFRYKDTSNYRRYNGEGLIYDHYYPYAVRKNPSNVGIIGVGGGKDVLMALHAGAANVYGAEFNGTIHDILKTKYASYAGNLAVRSNVHLTKDEGRFFIRSSKRKYDVLVFDNAVAQTAVSSGAFTIAESYLYSVEAFTDYLTHLTPGGIIYFSNPIPDASRFVTVFREAFRRMGRAADFSNSIIVADNHSSIYRKCKVLVKNAAFTPAERDAAIAFIASQSHEIMYAPGGGDYNTEVSRLVLTKNIDRMYMTANSELRPSTDDWPFFTQRMKPHIKEYTADNYAVNRFYPEPFLMLKRITGDVTLWSLAFLILPLLVFNIGGLRKLTNKVGSIVYFASLGLGFMFMEIVLMQKYMLILGHPVYSFSVVLSALLVSSGIGSFVSERFKSPYNAIRFAVLAVIAAAGISYLVSHLASSAIIEMPFIARVVIIALLTSLSGFFMGFLMPSGIRAVSGVESSIPWLWSVNSVFSVVASFLAIYISIQYGFTAVLIASIAIYVIGAIGFTFTIKMRA